MSVKSDEAAASIWEYAREDKPRNLIKNRRKARLRGIIQALVGVFIGSLIFFFWSQTLAYFVFGISGIVAVLALFSPEKGFGFLEKLFLSLGSIIGVFMGVILLTPLYFFFFTPFNILFRRGDKNIIRREFPGRRDSYWISREDEKIDSKIYKQQF